MAVDGEPMGDVGDLQRLMVAERIGQGIQVDVVRDGAFLKLDLIPRELETLRLSLLVGFFFPLFAERSTTSIRPTTLLEGGKQDAEGPGGARQQLEACGCVLSREPDQAELGIEISFGRRERTSSVS